MPTTILGYPAEVTKIFRQSFNRVLLEGLGFKTQATWYIDPVNGNDENVGDTSLRPVKTWNEVLKRRPDGRFSQATTFTFLNDLPSNDPFDLSLWSADPAYQVNFKGSPTTISTGTLTSFTARNPATRTPNQVTDTGRASWSLYISGGYMIKMTSGAASGFYAYIAKDLGSNAARVSTFFNPVTLTEAVPSAGDTYAIIKMTAIPRWNIGTVGAGRRYVFDDLDFYSTTITPNYFSNNGINFRNCRLYSLPMAAGIIRYMNCCVDYFQGYNGFALVFAGMGFGATSNRYIEIEHGQQFQVSDGTLFQGINVEVINDGYIRAYDMAVFDSYADGIRMHAGGKLRAEKVWGSGNAGYGINTYGSGQVWLNTSVGTPSITGNSGDVRLNQITKTWNEIIAAGYLKDADSSASISTM